jgi:phosphatidylserine/phosphatidylglycerophosphate/cardiolipin synthase-like enzyme
MFRYFKLLPKSPTDLLASKLYDENSFYDQFMRDLKKCQHEVIIESPFITNRRLSLLLSTLEKLKSKNVRVAINTRDPEEHEDDHMKYDALLAISRLQHAGIHVLYTSRHHRKLAIIDRDVLYEGSLNILSQNNSCEVMRRIQSVQLAWQMARFIKIDRFIQ